MFDNSLHNVGPHDRGYVRSNGVYLPQAYNTSRLYSTSYACQPEWVHTNPSNRVCDLGLYVVLVTRACLTSVLRKKNKTPQMAVLNIDNDCKHQCCIMARYYSRICPSIISHVINNYGNYGLRMSQSVSKCMEFDLQTNFLFISDSLPYLGSGTHGINSHQDKPIKIKVTSGPDSTKGSTVKKKICSSDSEIARRFSGRPSGTSSLRE